MPLAILNGSEQYEKCDLREPVGVEKRLLQTAPSPYRSHLSRGSPLARPSATLPLAGTSLERKAHESRALTPTITEPNTTGPGCDCGERGVAKAQARLSKTDKQLGRILHRPDQDLPSVLVDELQWAPLQIDPQARQDASSLEFVGTKKKTKNKLDIVCHVTRKTSKHISLSQNGLVCVFGGCMCLR